MLQLRFAVKDIIDVAGLETGCGNRNYRDFSTPQASSAPCIQQLLEAGAILVGKTKTTQFAEGQAALQWSVCLAFSLLISSYIEQARSQGHVSTSKPKTERKIKVDG